MTSWRILASSVRFTRHSGVVSAEPPFPSSQRSIRSWPAGQLRILLCEEGNATALGATERVDRHRPFNTTDGNLPLRMKEQALVLRNRISNCFGDCNRHGFCLTAQPCRQIDRAADGRIIQAFG